MNWLSIIMFIIVYIVGYFLTLFILHRFKKELGIDEYDNNHDNYPEDYHSNAEAYAIWCIVWPLILVFWITMLIWKFLLWVSKKMDKMYK